MWPRSRTTLIYLECRLRIETSYGWANSMSKVLKSFKDLSYNINQPAGFAYLKGKVDPQKLLSKLRKAEKHVTLEWSSYVFHIENQGNGYNNHHFIPQGPFYTIGYPYDPNVYQFNHPNPNWNNMPQYGLPYHAPERQHSTEHMFEGTSFSSQSSDSQSPVRSNHHQSDVGNSSLPVIQPENNNQTNDQPAQRSSFMKKIAEKLCLAS
ncbi:hypothetical protein MtrunA17_Chr7g0225461 [Medicago truncatula]|uniref:Uncharacterized protein n=2 Tax=Medicago truncatula TaxID=3880 RepID=A0A072U847_MEDTR|nr:hypothetical protein MTR_7g029145 [Medicago truncatula]RHN44994.1 hypothetical protein MtrunA17_Chr7g0225461 [Medicago truncatula]